MPRTALHFPASTKPADITVIGKRPATGSVPKMTPGAVRVWKLVAWSVLVLFWLAVAYACFYGARP